MARAVILVLVLLLVMAYLSLFVGWNAGKQPVVTWQLGVQYTQEMPIYVLFFAGLLVGAGTMALALTGPWNNLKQSDAQARALLEKAKGKLRTQDEKIKQLSAQAAAPQPTGDLSTEPEVAPPAGAEEGEPAAEKPPAEDPEEV